MHALVNSFRGETPLVTPRALPDNAAQSAVNARLFTGDLTAWKQFALTEGLLNAGPVETIFLLDTDVWLSWDQQVDVARGIIPGDTTRRTYLTGLDVPRFTNLALATSGGKPWPTQTRILGVPSPDSPPTLVVGVDNTPTTFSVDITDPCNDLATAWILSSPQVHSGTYVSEVLQDNAFGNPLPSFSLEADNNTANPAYFYRDFGTASASVIRGRWDFYIDNTGSNDSANVFTMFACGPTGSGARVYAARKLGQPAIIGISMASSFSGGNGNVLAEVTSAVSNSWNIHQWYSIDATMTANPDGTSTIVAALYLGATKLAEVTSTNVFTHGGVFGGINGKGDDALTLHYDNFHITASGSLNNTITNIATSYVYTFVNDIGEESAPSLASVTIQRPDGVTVTVTTPTTVPTGVNNSDYGITTKRIYRAATGATGTSFLFVAEIPLAQASYDDTLTDSELGEALQSSIWALPPSDLRGILALPNGVMCGFSKNQLCFSAQNQPHAWPVEYRLNTDTNIVGIGNIDNTVIIGTESFLYVATGNDPAAYSMSKFEVPYACSSKRSFAYLTGIGVVFAGPDGLMACSGVGQVRNLTDERLFTRRQWQALNPPGMIATAHNDVYFLFWESGSARGCYAIDTKPNGFGVVEMAFHATAAYTDPIEDKLYLVLDSDEEPSDVMLPVLPTIPNYVDGTTIFEFEGSPTDFMTYRWLSKLWYLPKPSVMQIAQVRAAPGGDYANVIARFYGDGEVIDELVIDGETVFTLAEAERYTTYQMELIGTSSMSVFQAAEDVKELV